MRHILFCSAASLLFAVSTSQAHADTFQFSFSGPAVSGNVAVTYGPARDAKYSQALEVTGISGTFSDTNLSISDASITGLEAINHATPDPTNLLAPDDFSRFHVASGAMHNSLSFDNLFYPDGSPQTASEYPPHGGFLDIYGLLFDIGDNRVVNLWSNGVFPPTSFADYGVSVATSAKSLDYVEGSVAITPEPSTLCLLFTGSVAALLRRRL